MRLRPLQARSGTQVVIPMCTRYALASQPPMKTPSIPATGLPHRHACVSMPLLTYARFAIVSGYFVWSELYLAFIIVHNVFTLLLLFPLSFLLLFHLRLCYKGLTTYQWLQLYGNPNQREYDSGEFAGDYQSFAEEIVRHLGMPEPA